jgi:hypothetical protein
MPVRTSNGCAGKTRESIGSFQNNDDFYSAPTNYRHNYSSKQNISSSFGRLSDFVCYSCKGEGHRVLYREGEGVEARELAPVAFILSDQNFPPSLPVEGEGECFKVFRIEDAGLHELVTAFLEATRGFVMPAGSVVVLSSASYMAWVGAAAYAQDCVSARARLRAAFRGGIEIVHGVPILVDGVQDCAGAWAVNDVNTWLEHMSKNSIARDIANTRGVFVKIVSGADQGGSPLVPPRGTVTPSAAVSYNVLMPDSFENKTKAVYEMSHLPIKTFINSFSYNECCSIIDSLVSELNEKFLTGLGEVDNPVKIGPDVNAEEMDAVKLVFVGSSHASRLAAAAEKLSIASSVVTLGSGRITTTAVEEAAKKLKEELASSVCTVVVVFTIYDNNAFFGVSDDGSKSLPVRGDGGECRYYVPGKLEVADHSVVKPLVNLSIPLLRAAGEKEKIILSPLPRYILPCCQNEKHITNRKDPEFKETIVDSRGGRFLDFLDFQPAATGG